MTKILDMIPDLVDRFKPSKKDDELNDKTVVDIAFPNTPE